MMPQPSKAPAPDKSGGSSKLKAQGKDKAQNLKSSVIGRSHRELPGLLSFGLLLSFEL
jgi:hypothetical protein